MSRKFQLHSASATESANNFLRYLSISPVGEPDDEYTLGEAMVDSFACCTVFPTNASISSTKNGGGVATIAAALTAQEEARSNAPLSGSSDTLLAQQLTGKMLDATEAHPQLVDVPTLTPTSGLASVPHTEISAGAAVKQGDSDFLREHHGASAASQLGGPATLEAKECQDETNGCTRKGRKKSTALSTLKKLPSFVFRRCAKCVGSLAFGYFLVHGMHIFHLCLGVILTLGVLLIKKMFINSTNRHQNTERTAVR